MKLICLTSILLSNSILLLNTEVNAEELIPAEPLYKQQNSFRHKSEFSTAPDLSRAGPWRVGVQTIDTLNAEQLDTTDFSSTKDRPLKLEVWYPTRAPKEPQAHNGSAKPVYDDVTRSGKTFLIQSNALRNAPLPQLNEDDKNGFPLVVLSHGYTGYRTMMFYLGEHLASHGYVVVGIDHTDSTNKDIDFAANSGSGFPSTLYNRARDQQFVLNYFSAAKSKFSKISDTQSASVIGYSMGGYGALNTVGGCYRFSSDRLKKLGFPEQAATALSPVFSSCSAGREQPDSRWKAMVAFAPWGGEQDVHNPDSLNKVTVPSLIIAGDQDDVSGYENGVKKLYEQLGSKQKYMLVYENARHNIAAHPAPEVAYGNELDIGHYHEPSWNSETINHINKHMVLAFLDWHIKGKQSAYDYLPKRETALQTKDQDGKLNAPWPGFSDRWGMGLRFYRAR